MQPQNTISRAHPHPPPPRPSLPGLSLPGLGAHMEEKHGGKSLIYKSVTMELENLSYPGNVWGVVITGTIGPLGNGRISQIQFLSMSQRQIQTQKDRLVTKRKSH